MRKVIRNFLHIEPGSWECTFCFLGNFAGWSKALWDNSTFEEDGYYIAKQTTLHSHFTQTDFFTFHWEAFREYILKHFLMESDYGVGSEKSWVFQIEPPCFLASPPSMAYVTKSPNSAGKGKTCRKGRTVGRDLRSLHHLHDLASLLKLLIIFLKFCWSMLLSSHLSE